MTGKTVLIADDEMHVTHILTFKLSQSGINVLTAGDGEEAYDLACQYRPHIIITDLQMPGMNGLEMAMKLRQRPDTADIPIVMLTARGHKLDTSEMDKTNIKAVVAKPFSARALLAKAVELLGAAANDDTPLRRAV